MGRLSLSSAFHILQRFLNAGRKSRSPTGNEHVHASELLCRFTQINLDFLHKLGAFTLLGQLKPPLHPAQGERWHDYP